MICAVLCWAGLCWAGLCWAVLGWAVLCCAVLGWAGLCPLWFDYAPAPSVALMKASVLCSCVQ